MSKTIKRLLVIIIILSAIAGHKAVADSAPAAVNSTRLPDSMLATLIEKPDAVNRVELYEFISNAFQEELLDDYSVDEGPDGIILTCINDRFLVLAWQNGLYFFNKKTGEHINHFCKNIAGLSWLECRKPVGRLHPWQVIPDVSTKSDYQWLVAEEQETTGAGIRSAVTTVYAISDIMGKEVWSDETVRYESLLCDATAKTPGAVEFNRELVLVFLKEQPALCVVGDLVRFKKLPDALPLPVDIFLWNNASATWDARKPETVSSDNLTGRFAGLIKSPEMKVHAYPPTFPALEQVLFQIGSRIEEDAPGNPRSDEEQLLYARASAYYEMSARQGDKFAAFRLGMILENGLGGRKDPERARRLLKQSEGF